MLKVLTFLTRCRLLIHVRTVRVLFSVFLFWLAGVSGSWGNGLPESVVVADDQFYPPFAFLSKSGEPRGITVDIWKLWSRKTGIPVEFRLMEWNRVLEEVRDGRADVIGGVFRTPAREAYFDFINLKLDIRTAIFFHRQISGIKGFEDIAAFRTGVIRGDSAEELLKNRHPAVDLAVYPGMETLVHDAVAGNIKVFVADVPTARFYLARIPGGENFRQGACLPDNPLFSAVRKGNGALLTKIRDGFDQISPAEIDDILSQWYGRSAVVTIPWTKIAFILIGVVFFAGIVVFWNFLLRRRIAMATLDIMEKNRQLLNSHKALSLSEKKFRLIFENAPYTVAIRYLEDDRFLDVNRAFLNKTGLTKEEVLRMNVRDLFSISQEDQSAIIEALKKHGVVRDRELTGHHRDGSPAHLVFSAVLLDVEGESQVLLMIVDMTEKMQAQEALKKSEKKFRNIFNNAPIGIFRSSFEGRLLEANATLARMFGYGSREEMFYSIRNLDDEIYSSPRERRSLLDALIQSPQGVRLEIEFKRKDNMPLHTVINASLQMDEKGHPAYIDGSVEDITARKRAETELRRLAAAVEQSGEIIMITDAGGIIQYVNRAFERITGFSRREAVGQMPTILKSGEHNRPFYAELWRTISRGETWAGRLVNRRKDGSRLIEESTISPVFGADGGIVNYVAAKRDITHELALEEQNRQMQKMEAIGQLTGGVAHDFNNLLQAINGYTDLAIMELPPQHPAHDFLEQARKAGQRAANLVQQLLLFSRRKIMQPKILNLNAVVADLLKMLERIIGEHIRIEWQPCREPCIINADGNMLDQVLMNLCVNARDAMESGGVLTIETRAVLIDDGFCAVHAWARPGHFVLLDVTDTGCGMEQDTLEHIFEPFFTTRGRSGGTGLGLATVYGIVKQHDGMIDVYSEPEKGTTFKVYLPLCEQRKEGVDSRIPMQAGGGRETILLAEDDEAVRELSRMILKGAGYTVLTAEDGEEAVAVFKRHADSIALLILDVVMPRLGGRGAFERIRALQPDIKSLFSSGYSESAIHTDFVLHEGLKLLQKPYAPNELLQAVRKALDSDDRV